MNWNITRMAVAIEVSIIPDFYLFYLQFSKNLLNSTEECHHTMSHVTSEVLYKLSCYII